MTRVEGDLRATTEAIRHSVGGVHERLNRRDAASIAMLVGVALQLCGMVVGFVYVIARLKHGG